MNNNMYNNQMQQQPGYQGYPQQSNFQQPIQQGYPQPIYNTVGKKSNNTGLVIAIVAILILVIGVIAAIGYGGSSNKKNDVSGNYNCKKYSGSGESSDYSITLKLNTDNTFFYGPYGRTENNYAKGTYSYVDLQKTNGSGEYKYYTITFEGEAKDFVVEGEPQDHGFNSKMEFGLTTKDGKRQGILMFMSNYNMYYCYEE